MTQLLHPINRLVERLLVPSHRSNRSELMDADDLDPTELATNFRDIRRVNQLLGGTSAIIRNLPALFATQDADRPIVILDLATGVGDIPVAILKWAKQRNRRVHIVASDWSGEILALARIHTSGHQEITLERYDAREVPLPDKQFDIVLCSLSLHHFGPEDGARVLGEMRRLARTGIIVNDLYRSRAGFIASWIASRLTTRNRLTRNDAPLSVLRAYTPSELDALLRHAQFESITIRKHLWFRMTAVGRSGSV